MAQHSTNLSQIALINLTLITDLPFDPDLWDTYSCAIRKETRCRAVQDEMDKYDIPLDDRYEWDIARSPSGLSALPPPGRYSRVPPIKVDISLDFDTIDDAPDHQEFEKTLREIYRYGLPLDMLISSDIA
jgi:hypothetical protein